MKKEYTNLVHTPQTSELNRGLYAITIKVTKKFSERKTSARRNGTHQPSKIGMTPQYFYTIPTSCAAISRPHNLCLLVCLTIHGNERAVIMKNGEGLDWTLDWILIIQLTWMWEGHGAQIHHNKPQSKFLTGIVQYSQFFECLGLCLVLEHSVMNSSTLCECTALPPCVHLTST